MQCLGRQSQVASRSVRRAGYAPFSGARVQHVVPQAAGNGASPAPAAPKPVPKFPAPAETARTVLDLVNEGVLSTVTANGVPVGIPVSYSLTKTGDVKLNMDAQTLKLANVSGSTTCSLTVQATTMPARAVAAITLVGKVDVSDSQEHGFVLDKVLYFGGLDQAPRGHEISGEEFKAAEADVLRKAAVELVQNWNSERAEDIYRIVGQHLGIALADMAYAELLWVDHLGMYVRCESLDRAPEVVRVPFYRPVLDERDARSVITMAAQIAWEQERTYTPPVPSIFADAANNN